MTEKPNKLPFLTEGIEGTGGIIKVRNMDFIVEEVPLYPARGSGTHLYFKIEKDGIGTMEAVSRIAHALDVLRKDIGYAGLKDAHAITQQWLSVEHIDEQELKELEVKNIKFLEFTKHENKIRTGHLSGNLFKIKIRNLQLPLEKCVHQAELVLEILQRRGVPNFFGPQRFGNRNDGSTLGKAIIQGNMDEFVDLFLGRPQDEDTGCFRSARLFYEEGEYQRAVEAWPYLYSDQRRALRAMIKGGGKKKRAYKSIDLRLKKLFVSAHQSEIYNNVLVQRMPNIDKLLLGDMAYKHDNGACFRVENPEIEQPRCDAFDISPTGPIIGHHMTQLTDTAGEIENAIIKDAGLTDKELREMSRFGRGGRRPMRFKPKDSKISCGVDDMGEFLELQFELDSGCYATTLLREITKTEISYK